MSALRSAPICRTGFFSSDVAAARILVTRPALVAAPLIEALRAIGAEVLFYPLLTIQPTGQKQPRFRDVTALALTSRAAPLILKESRYALGRLADLPCYCVGDRTAAEAVACGFRAVRVGEGCGASLARLIAQKEGADAKVLHIGAQDADDDLEAGLRAGGAAYARWPVYRTKALLRLPAGLGASLGAGEVDAVLFLSARTAQTFAKAVKAQGFEPFCKQLNVCALSEKVLKALEPFALPFKKLASAERPDQTALVELVKKTCF